MTQDPDAIHTPGAEEITQLEHEPLLDIVNRICDRHNFPDNGRLRKPASTTQSDV